MPPTVMTIAGSDPSGSSGIQADLPTLAAFDVHATSVITTLTAQDSTGVKAFHEVPLDLVAAQLDHLVADLPAAATKTGLLRSVEVIELVADRAGAGALGRLVVDPVLVDSTGAPIVSTAATRAYRRLIAGATIVTPNRWEAELLTGEPFADDPSPGAITGLRALGADTVIVTGGRGAGSVVVDVLIGPDGVEQAEAQRVGTEAIRGTGCTFSAAAAAGLGLGLEPSEAVREARAFVARQLAKTDALTLGAGRPGLPHGIGP